MEKFILKPWAMRLGVLLLFAVIILVLWLAEVSLRTIGIQLVLALAQGVVWYLVFVWVRLHWRDAALWVNAAVFILISLPTILVVGILLKGVEVPAVLCYASAGSALFLWMSMMASAWLGYCDSSAKTLAEWLWLVWISLNLQKGGGRHE